MLVIFFFFNQKTAYEMRISDWSSDVCSSDLVAVLAEFAVLAALHVKTGVEVERAATAVELRAQSLSLPGDQIDTVALDRLHPHDVAHRHAFGRLFLFPDARQFDFPPGCRAFGGEIVDRRTPGGNAEDRKRVGGERGGQYV